MDHPNGSLEKKKNPYKIAFFIQLIVLVGVLAVSIYFLIDQGVSLTYLSQGCEDTQKDLKVLMSLFPPAAKELDRKGLIFLLRKNHPDAFIVEEPTRVSIGFLEFEFSAQGTLQRVRHSMGSEGDLTEKGVQGGPEIR